VYSPFKRKVVIAENMNAMFIEKIFKVIITSSGLPQCTLVQYLLKKQTSKNYCLKDILHPNMKMLSLFTHLMLFQACMTFFIHKLDISGLQCCFVHKGE